MLILGVPSIFTLATFSLWITSVLNGMLLAADVGVICC